MTHVGIITINWNGIEDTRQCLDSLRDIDDPHLTTYVVDNGSANDEAARLKGEYPWCRVLPQPTNLGFTGGCNVGIEAALADQVDYLVLLNNDAVVEPDFLGPLLDFHRRTPDAGAIGPLMMYSGRDEVWSAGGTISALTGFTMVEGKGRTRASYDGAAPFETDFVAGCCLMVAADLVRQVGDLDDRYFAYYEDLDWCFRMRRLGHRSYTVPSSVIHHRKSASTGEAGTDKLSPVAAYYMARNACYFGRVNLPVRRRVPFLLAQFAVRAPYNLILRSQPGARRHYLRGLAAGIRYR